ncbi:glucose-fructose oxidoreductase domain-containing protein 1 [Ostrinia nubilalis]|uniref:glucose-fructose oxidoreductase domain-containing protein 1 n=1 Tax=Ostrinia furnacalis TaxID=93504 RepID=UPI00103F0278|nr:glucose-fructose oxidoreductase domain-containing protein 1 [Ostrinia furnacalis]
MLPGIGVFGTGAIAKVLVPFLREKGFSVEAIWGITLQEAEAAAKELKIPFFTNKIDDVLLKKNVNLVFIVCAPNLHAQISVKALGIGKHVVCDKPAGLCQAEALKMVRAAQYYPTLISIVNHSLRFLPAFSHMKKCIQDGYLGNPDELTLIDVRVQMGPLVGDTYNWLCDDTMGGGTLSLVGSHVIDLVSFLTGQKVVKVHGVLRTFVEETPKVNGIRKITAPDFCTFQLEMDKGLLVTATLNNHLPGPCFNQEIYVCSKNGYLVVRGGDLHGRLHKTTAKAYPEEDGKRPHEKEEVIYVDVEDLSCASSVVPKPYIKGLCKMISALKEAFLPVKEQMDWIKEPVRAAANFEDGQRVQATMEALRQSNEDGCWISVTLLTEPPDPNPALSAAVRRTAISLQ